MEEPGRWRYEDRYPPPVADNALPGGASYDAPGKPDVCYQCVVDDAGGEGGCTCLREDDGPHLVETAVSALAAEAKVVAAEKKAADVLASVMSKQPTMVVKNVEELLATASKRKWWCC